MGGWEILCNATGIPFAWFPLAPNEVAGAPPGSVNILSADEAALRAFRCKSIVKSRHGGPVPGTDLEIMLQQVFGVR